MSPSTSYENVYLDPGGRRRAAHGRGTTTCGRPAPHPPSAPAPDPPPSARTRPGERSTGTAPPTRTTSGDRARTRSPRPTGPPAARTLTDAEANEHDAPASMPESLPTAADQVLTAGKSYRSKSLEAALNTQGTTPLRPAARNERTQARHRTGRRPARPPSPSSTPSRTSLTPYDHSPHPWNQSTSRLSRLAPDGGRAGSGPAPPCSPIPRRSRPSWT